MLVDDRVSAGASAVAVVRGRRNLEQPNAVAAVSHPSASVAGVAMEPGANVVAVHPSLNANVEPSLSASPVVAVDVDPDENLAASLSSPRKSRD